jgi:hypothetical protein
MEDRKKRMFKSIKNVFKKKTTCIFWIVSLVFLRSSTSNQVLTCLTKIGGQDKVLFGIRYIVWA